MNENDCAEPVLQVAVSRLRNIIYSKLQSATLMFSPTENSSNRVWFLTEAEILSDKMETGLINIYFWVSYWHFCILITSWSIHWISDICFIFHSFIYLPFFQSFTHFTLRASISFTHWFSFFFSDHPSFQPSHAHLLFYSLIYFLLLLPISFFTHSSLDVQSPTHN